MGQKSAKERLEKIQEHVESITETLQTTVLGIDDRYTYEETLEKYSDELQLILSKSLKSSKIERVQSLIDTALLELEEANKRSVFKRIDSHLNYFSALHAKENLENIGKSMEALLTNLNLKNLQSTKVAFNTLKEKVESIEEVTEAVAEKKSEIFTTIAKVEHSILVLETEDKLEKAEESHLSNILDLESFVGVSNSKSYRSYKKFLQGLKEEVVKILEVSEDVAVRKNYLLFNIDNNLVALDVKAKENEDKIKKQVEPVTNQRLIEALIKSYKNLEKGFSLNCPMKEVKEIFSQLSEVKGRIDQKIKDLQSQLYPQTIPPSKKRMLRRQSSCGDILIDLMTISSNINEIGNKIKTGTCSDDKLNYIEEDLKEHLKYLRNLKILPARTNICKYRDYVLIQIENHLSNLRKIKMNAR